MENTIRKAKKIIREVNGVLEHVRRRRSIPCTGCLQSSAIDGR
jgi:hypothetical protein